ncbi:MAG: DUF3299 domain-containing protein [Micavibrio sp.]|nr:DUF3299 domain-containing protein [Micavibrio sp.]
MKTIYASSCLRIFCVLGLVFMTCALSKAKYTVTTTTVSGTITPDDSAAAAQPADERAAQDALPKSTDNMWTQLNNTKVKLNEKTGMFDMNYGDSVKALAGKKLAITGFMLPLEGGETQKHFLLCKRTPTCPFCMPGGPTEVVEIYSEKPITWIDDMVRIEGDLTLLPPNENGMLYQLKNATEVKISKP